MSIEEYKNNSPNTFNSWLNLVTKIFTAVEKHGESFVIWENLSVEMCQEKESIAVELEMYEAASIYRDNIHKCYDYTKK